MIKSGVLRVRETTTKLVGCWSSGEGFIGHASDERMVFLADGGGRLEYWNGKLCSAYKFRWRIKSQGLLELQDDRALVPNRQSAESKRLLQFPEVRYIVSELERPPGTGSGSSHCNSICRCRGRRFWGS